MTTRAVLAAGLVVVVIAGAVAAGSMRYGGMDGLYRRVHAEVAARQPHPLLAPTPLPVSEFDSPLANVKQAGSPAPAAQSTFMTGQPSSTSTRPRSNTPVPATVATATKGPRTITPTNAAPASPRSLQVAVETPQVAPQPRSLPTNIQLTGLTHMWQTWNNCGPATLAMHLSHFGLNVGQGDVAASIRPNKEDKNVSPDELAAFARAQGLHATVRVNGNPDRLRELLAIGLPVLVETWHEPKPNDGMGHYRLLTGYNEAEQVWFAFDSYDARGIDPKEPYAGIRIPYDELDHLWAVFNRPYVVVYTEAMADQVKMILGDDFDDEAMWKRALSGAQHEVQQDPVVAFSWFNMGSDLTALGRYEEAAKAYDKARRLGLPWRMFWYQFGPFKAYYQVGRYEEVVGLATATLRTAKYVEELYYWRGLAQLAQAKTGEAQVSFQRALEMNRFYTPAAEALAALPVP